MNVHSLQTYISILLDSVVIVSGYWNDCKITIKILISLLNVQRVLWF